MVSDITFIGSGIATTVTLIELFEKLLDKRTNKHKLNIAVIEKNKELWLGVPYGSRSSVNALSITHVHDFIYEQERPLFFKWLKANIDDWAGYYKEKGGIIAARWLDKNISLIEDEAWEAVYIPRFIFGKYILEKFTALLKKVQQEKLVELKVIQGEATDITIMAGGLNEVTLECPNSQALKIISRKVVVSIGSGPVKKMCENNVGGLVYINDIYDPSVSDNIKTIHAALSETTDMVNRNILLIGSNASAIELLYLIEGMHGLRTISHKIIVISPSGLLPYNISTETKEHKIPHLDQIKVVGNFTIETLIAAASQDLKLAVQNGANVAYIATVINNTLQLLDVLGEDARKEFIGIYGMKLSNMFRRSGPEYKHGSQLLIDLEEVTLLQGKFIDACPSKDGAMINYLDMATGQTLTYPLNFKVMINCSGSAYLNQSSSKLIHNLISKNICKINLSEKGFEVNERFEASPNVYIMGPMLGGNMNKLIHFWHLENAPRLMYLAPYLAEVLLEG